MAIDDNTSYELTGAQVKDLASKINAKADSSSLATVATSGSYNDLSDKPTIQTVNDGTLTIQQNGTTVGTFTANQSSASTVSLTDTTYSAMAGATSSTAGASGLVPAPAAGDQDKFLTGDGTWKALTNIFYPVGSIYMSATLSTAAAVETALGGTWVAWGAGRVPVGVDTYQTEFNTVEETGGTKTVTLTVDQIPSHDHKAINWVGGYTGGSQANYKTLLEASSTTSDVKACQATGGGQSHNNLQPYITCYMYKRTA